MQTAAGNNTDCIAKQSKAKRARARGKGHELTEYKGRRGIPGSITQDGTETNRYPPHRLLQSRRLYTAGC